MQFERVSTFCTPMYNLPIGLMTVIYYEKIAGHDNSSYGQSDINPKNDKLFKQAVINLKVSVRFFFSLACLVRQNSWSVRPFTISDI